MCANPRGSGDGSKHFQQKSLATENKKQSKTTTKTIFIFMTENYDFQTKMHFFQLFIPNVALFMKLTNFQMLIETEVNEARIFSPVKAKAL